MGLMSVMRDYILYVLFSEQGSISVDLMFMMRDYILFSDYKSVQTGAKEISFLLTAWFCPVNSVFFSECHSYN